MWLGAVFFQSVGNAVAANLGSTPAASDVDVGERLQVAFGCVCAFG